MEQCPPLYFGEVTIEKGAFELPSTKVANFTTFYFYISNQSIQPVLSSTISELELFTRSGR